MSNSKDKIKISCIVLTCDSHIKKGSSVLHCVSSILNQNYNNFELIIVENSHSKPKKIDDLNNLISRCNKNRETPVKYKIVNNRTSLSWCDARNKGVKYSVGEILLFIDDDTIILQDDAFAIIDKLSSKYDFGYGAKRLWTRNDLFQKKSKALLDDIQKHNYSKLLAISDIPKASVRDYGVANLLSKTFIANFGFCRRSIFDKIGGFPDFKGYGFEDDYLMFRLFESGAKYRYMDNISVSHVNHDIINIGEKTFVSLFKEYTKRGFYSFHVEKTFTNKKLNKNDVLESLKTLHYDERIESAYKQYVDLPPLNIPKENKKFYKKWVDKYLYSKIDFVRLVNLLQNSKNINSFIKNSSSDFDNLGMVIKVAIDNDIISINKNGNINKKFEFVYTKPNKSTRRLKKEIIPNPKWNQFPCDSESRLRRLNLLKDRYPYAEYLSLGIIGDDDLLSTEIKDEVWIDPVIIELDKRLIDIIKSIDERFKVFETDIRSKKSLEILPKVQTFITDPPYTLHGILAFINAGLSITNLDGSKKEFYVIANPTMVGINLLHLQNILSEVGIYLVDIISNFSNYKLPENFEENERAVRMMKQLGVKPEVISYSSSSNLYVFQTINPNLDILKKQIKYNQIYNHFYDN